MSKLSVRRSKQLSWLLRHSANEAGLSMDEAGWADVEEVLVVLDMTRANLLDAVETNDKGRAQLDGARIRACQGHSLVGMPVTQDALERSWTVTSPASRSTSMVESTRTGSRSSESNASSTRQAPSCSTSRTATTIELSRKASMRLAPSTSTFCST
ncbi:MAG: RNA 2'-phosphotransferase [Actinobacteria bacterium]|nr:RNA 2'-phosphotransferase [Actinomycetota bacterium]